MIASTPTPPSVPRSPPPEPSGDGDQLQETPSSKPRTYYNLRLYVAGQTAKSVSAIANLKAICEKHLVDRYAIEVIDLRENPQLAAGDQILAVPTLVRHLPPPLKRIIGDLSDSERVLVGLDIRQSDNP